MAFASRPRKKSGNASRVSAITVADATEARQGLTKTLQPARNYVLWLLSRREYSEKELRNKLQHKGYSSDDIDSAIALCQSYNYQSDERYALGRARQDARRMGNRGVSMRLAQKGISAQLVAEQLEQLGPELERAQALLARHAGKPLDAPARARLWRYLACRGFASGTISKALDALARDAGQPAP